MMTTLLLMACGSTDDTTEAPDDSDVNKQEEDSTEQEEQEESEAPESEEETEPEFVEITLEGSLIPVVNWVWLDNQDIMTFAVERAEQELTKEERLKESLIQSDFTNHQSFHELLEVSIDDSTATLVFSQNQMFMSLASTEQLLLDEMLYQLTALFGVDTLVFYVEDQRGLDYGQTGRIETMSMEAESNRGYYLLVDEEAQGEREHALYVPRYQSDDRMTTESDFSETIEEMQQLNDQPDKYQPAIPEAVNVIDVKEEEGIVEIRFEAEDSVNLEDFYNIIELTALDFELETLQLVNELTYEIIAIDIN